MSTMTIVGIFVHSLDKHYNEDICAIRHGTREALKSTYKRLGMSELENVGKRISTALDRVEQVLKSGRLGAEPSATVAAQLSELAELKSVSRTADSKLQELETKVKEAEAKLEEAQTKLAESDEATAQLQRKLERATEQCEDTEGKLKFVRNKAWRFRKWSQEQIAEQKKMIEDLDVKLQALGQINRTLRDHNRKLRDANAEGLGDAELINDSLKSEVEAIRAHRDVEIAEFGAAHKALQNLLAGLEFDDASDSDPSEETAEANDSKSTKGEDA